jgi:hypothetical protein
MPSHSPSGGHDALVAHVSGPRTVTLVWPPTRVTTISQWLAATDENSPSRVL